MNTKSSTKCYDRIDVVMFTTLVALFSMGFMTNTGFPSELLESIALEICLFSSLASVLLYFTNKPLTMSFFLVFGFLVALSQYLVQGISNSHVMSLFEFI